MTNKEAIDELIIVRNVYDGMREAYKPCVEAIDMAISALQAQDAPDTNVDTISRQAAIEGLPPAQLGTNLAEVGTRAVRGYPIDADALMAKVAEEYGERARDALYRIIRYMPSAQPESLSDAYTKAVWTWLLDYQIKASELKGRYAPYEVLSWVANDWRKEHERFDKQTGGD